MIPNELVSAINELRSAFFDSVEKVREIDSFAAILRSSSTLPARLRGLESVSEHPQLQKPCDGRLTVAVIGSSGHGKTTVLDEMFPRLSERGWLVTDVTDTTAQSLRIEYAPPGSDELDRVSVSSWSAGEIKELMSCAEVEEQNEKDNIRVTYHSDSVDVDGSEASFPADDVAQFRFPKRIRLEPFAEPYQVSREQGRDASFIRALTVKEQSAVMKSGAVLAQDGRGYDALQLRALVKDVCLRDSFDQIAEWADLDEEERARLVFVDTPGLAVNGSVKDEVLRHFLEKKSAQIALSLWKNDELDIVVHLVLCGRQSDFATLWKSIERECGPAAMASLSQRLILAVNGMNTYFTNRDIKQKYEDPETARREGDHFATTLEDNVLQKMSPRGRVVPGRVCFLDAKSIVETLTSGSYEEAYRKYRPIMEKWTEPSGVGYRTLDDLGLVESFRKNIDALCDPEDRGQGFLVRQIRDVAREQGAALLLRRYVVRSGLIGGLHELRDTLGSYYDDEGRMNREATQAALRGCLSFLDRDDLDSIERFARDVLDSKIAEIVPSRKTRGEDWLLDCFVQMCDLLKENILFHGDAAPEIRAAFERHYDAQVRLWAAAWGYESARLETPERGFGNTGDLVSHCLRIHGREILYQLLSEDQVAVIEQDAGDRERVQDLISHLDRACRLGAAVCAEHGVEQ